MDNTTLIDDYQVTGSGYIRPILMPMPRGIRVTIKSGKNHGQRGMVYEYDTQSGGYRVIIDDPSDISKPLKKRFYALDRLETRSADDLYRLIMMAPPSRRKEKLIARAVGEKLTEQPPAPRQKLMNGGAYQGWVGRSPIDLNELSAVYDAVAKGTIKP